MKHIGYVIKEYRTSVGLTRKELAENICSEKYIYLLEKNERSPSSEMARLIGDKLGIDLFDFYNYLDCQDPLTVRETIHLFDKARRSMNLELLGKATRKAGMVADFENAPWSHEIFINNIYLDIFENKNYRVSINKINEYLRSLPPPYSRSVYIVNINILLSVCYQLVGDVKMAKDATLIADEIIRSKQIDAYHEQMLLFVELSMMSIAYLEKDYQGLIDIALDLNDNYSYISLCEWYHVVCFYLAFANYDLGMIEKASSYFEKGLHAICSYEKKYEMYFISRIKTFQRLINDQAVNRSLVLIYENKCDNREQASS